MDARKKLSVAMVMDPLKNIKPKKDSSVAMMKAAHALGADLFYLSMDDLFLESGRTMGNAAKIDLGGTDNGWCSLSAPQKFPLKDFDVIMMRKDPPVDKRFIHACYMLEQAEREGARVINNPTSLIALNEKLFAAQFSHLCPDTLVASDKDVLRSFLEKHKKIIIKPLDAMGGSGVFMVTDTDVNFDVIWEMQTGFGTYPVIAQEFLPSIADGDKRILVINGKAFDHVLVRSPKPGSIRGNMAAGGLTQVRLINPAERAICDEVGKVLTEKGILFAGLDIIGDRLIEINITSPTGIQEISNACGVNVADLLMREVLR